MYKVTQLKRYGFCFTKVSIFFKRNDFWIKHLKFFVKV
ncbi:hypothetical protein Premu_1629 [Hallella multisaccharivorax DSM 17128]|uniref:Uncharacterized protein n=1 Tax=Hallella multisaccharivorax DSM 17128 TaxID=688246 RepID=F8NCK3_9BACT|nr:hypothetical protein Premu_1629 [Hallella multisaccharivorax DSM 17128]